MLVKGSKVDSKEVEGGRCMRGRGSERRSRNSSDG